MKYVVSVSFVNIVGRLWYEGQATQHRKLDPYDIESVKNCGDGRVDRDAVETWLHHHTGDFSEIIDFEADLETDEGNVVIPWENEDSAMAYDDSDMEIETE